MKKDKALIVFEGNDIRRIWHNGEWHYSVIDVIATLTASSIPKRYWTDLKSKLKEEEGFEVYGLIVRLKLKAPDDKLRETDCANVETLFRIIQSIPSPNANKFKLWLARVGYERTQEIENPELAQNRAKEYYKMKGYPKDWIEKRVRGIAIRNELTDEWKERGVTEGKEFAILTNEISKATFGVSIKEHKELKSLDPKFKNQNLRDHMDDLELIFSMLGERVSTEITKNEDSQGYEEVEDASKRGGRVAGNARKETEKEIGRSVTSKENYLFEPEKKLLTEKEN